LPENSGYAGDLTLASLDSIGDPDDLRDQVRRQLHDGRADGQPPPVQEGADGSDSVWVSIDAQGGLVGVEISRQWRDRIGPADFPSALFDAYTEATRKVLTASALAKFTGTAEPPPAAQPDRSADRPVDGRDWLAQTWVALDEVETELDRLARLDAAASGSTAGERTVPGPDGLLTARVRGANIVGVTGSTARIAAAGVEQLRHEATAVLRAAETGKGR
jgi:hypothetical protein